MRSRRSDRSPTSLLIAVFFFNDTATTEIYTLSLHDALPIFMLICILTKNVITSCSVTMMLFLHLEVKPLMTLTTVLGTFVKDWFRYESHFVHGRDSLVDILKERGLLSESDAVQPLIGKKS